MTTSAQSPLEPSGTPSRRVLDLARAGVSICFFLNGFSFASWVSRIPILKHDLGLTDPQFGTALFALAAGALIGFPLAGVTCARFGSRSMSILLGLAFSVFLALIPFAHSLSMLAVVLVGFGVFHGAMDVAMNTNGVEVEAHFGRSIMSSLHGMYSLGGLTGSGIGWLLTRYDVSTSTHLVLAAALFAVVALVTRKIMLGEKPTGHLDHPIFAIPSKPLFAIGLIITCSFLCEGAMGDWSGIYLRESLHTTVNFAVIGYFFYSLMMTIARFSGDKFLTKWGPVRVLRVAGVIASVGFAAALILGQPWVALIGFGCIGLGMSTVAPIGFGAAGRAEGIPSGSAIASVATMGYSGFLIGPPIIGALAGWITLRGALGVVAVLAAMIAVLAPAAAHGARES